MEFQQATTGVPGLDKVLNGGYLRGCPTLFIGQPGCGKTLFLLMFLAEGARQGMRSVCATCTETPERLQAYLRALGHPVDDWLTEGTLAFVDLRPLPGEVMHGGLDQEIVMVRLATALKKDDGICPGARLAIDDMTRLAYGFHQADAVAREHTHKLLQLLRGSEVTTLISVSDTVATRNTLVDYVADAVIELSQSVEGRLMTRTLRVMKMRGVNHGTNEYPFMIESQGPMLVPVTALNVGHASRSGMISTGHERLDGMLGGGLYRGGSMMVSGTSGTGKTNLCGQVALGLCSQGLRTLYLSFEQDQSELQHDFKRIGLDTEPKVRDGSLSFARFRSVDHGLEDHLIRIAHLLTTTEADAIVIDAISAFADLGDHRAVKNMVLRLVDLCKTRGISCIMTELLSNENEATSSLGLSSLLDVWARLELYRQKGEYIRLIRVLKGRGANTSQQIKEFRITENGLEIEDPYVGSGSFVFGTEKLIREQAERHENNAAAARLEHLNRQLEAIPQSFDARFAQVQLERDEALNSLRSEIARVELALNAAAKDAQSILLARGGN
ncbi:circadian clock protein KaiC [Rhodospira trueperi]|uniref:Circadian clock protein KaiC n=1 Tax=Rhodospira trueperi TaxID=69960 RepID=A0A1G7DEP8_9PROT|nr:circadian clock protein KaiC [Rhodospira trueperi]SDE49993.1 circadian clock protein KaiC [Rhodospira trueperi]